MITQQKCFRILFVSLIFIFPTLLFSQDQTIHLKKGRLYTVDGFEIKFLNLNQQGSKFTAETKKGKFSVFDQEDVLRIDRKSGTKALAWGGYLGAFSLVETWLILTINDNISSLRPASYGNKNKHLIIGMTSLGTLVGLLIGSSKGKYKRVYDDPAFTFSPKNLGVNFSSPNNISSLTLSYQF